MPKYKIGVTEAGDAGIDLRWTAKMPSIDGAVLVTKHITPDFLNAVIEHKNKIIVHATITGYGGTILEPGVPKLPAMFDAVMALVHAGFPQEKIVIRVDPIIPTEKGLGLALRVMEQFMDMQFSRYRVSVIDMYPHVRKRFTAVGLPLPYGNQMFAGTELLGDTDAMLLEAKAYWNASGCASKELRIESCAEPWLKEPIICGCISAFDLELLGLDPYEGDTTGRQRTYCMCYSGKTELLTGRHPCRHSCLYCYWKDVRMG